MKYIITYIKYGLRLYILHAFIYVQLEVRRLAIRQSLHMKSSKELHFT